MPGELLRVQNVAVAAAAGAIPDVWPQGNSAGCASHTGQEQWEKLQCQQCPPEQDQLPVPSRSSPALPWCVKNMVPARTGSAALQEGAG